jgi:hypothetical protein
MLAINFLKIKDAPVKSKNHHLGRDCRDPDAIRQTINNIPAGITLILKPVFKIRINCCQSKLDWAVRLLYQVGHIDAGRKMTHFFHPGGLKFTSDAKRNESVRC